MAKLFFWIEKKAFETRRISPTQPAWMEEDGKLIEPPGLLFRLPFSSCSLPERFHFAQLPLCDQRQNRSLHRFGKRASWLQIITSSYGIRIDRQPVDRQKKRFIKTERHYANGWRADSGAHLSAWCGEQPMSVPWVCALAMRRASRESQRTQRARRFKINTQCSHCGLLQQCTLGLHVSYIM